MMSLLSTVIDRRRAVEPRNRQCTATLRTPLQVNSKNVLMLARRLPS
jgi:hypothetical protein